MNRGTMIALALLVSGCAVATPRPRREFHAYWIPPSLKDTDYLCVPANPHPLCRPVGEVRALLVSLRAAP